MTFYLNSSTGKDIDLHISVSLKKAADKAEFIALSVGVVSFTATRTPLELYEREKKNVTFRKPRKLFYRFSKDRDLHCTARTLCSLSSHLFS